MFSQNVIKKLLKTSVPLFQELKETYALLPASRCQRKTDCCSILPQAALVEALAVIRRLVNMEHSIRGQLIQNIIGYFFLNPVKITSCPFLDSRDCLIYADRFLGCRS